MQKVYRLTHRASFAYIYKNGEKAGSRLFALRYLKAGSLKIGISVSKKVGNSVVRSLVKRRIKEAFRSLIPEINGKYNYIVVAKDDAATATFAEIKGELTRVLSKLGHLTGQRDA